MTFIKLRHNDGETYLVVNKVVSFSKTDDCGLGIDVLGGPAATGETYSYEFIFESERVRNKAMRALIAAIVKEG